MRYVDVFTPDSIIAAALNVGTEDPREVAYNNAAYALDREDVHLIYSVDKEVVYYIAAASEDFAGHLSAVTPLAAALPGTKAHQEDGAYVAIAESGYAVVVKKGQEMFSYVGDREAVDAFILGHQVPTYSASETAAIPWEGYNLGGIQRAQKLAKFAIMLGAVFAFLAAMAWFGVASFGRDVDAEAASIKRETESSVRAAADQINNFAKQPVIENIRDLQTLISKASEIGGYVVFYELSGNKESWEIELPGWATSEIIEEFGRGLKPTKDEERNIIIVRKGEASFQSKNNRRR